MSDLAFSPDGGWLYTLTDDGAVTRWQMSSARPTLLIPAANPERTARRLLISPDGARLIVVSAPTLVQNAAHGMDLYDAGSGGRIAHLSDYVADPQAVRLSSDGSHVVLARCAIVDQGCLFGTGMQLSIASWDLATGKSLGEAASVVANYPKVWAADGDSAWIAANTCADQHCVSGHVEVWDTTTKSLLGEFGVDVEDPTLRLVFSPTHRLWAIEHNHVQIWDVPSRTLKAHFNVNMAEIHSITFSAQTNQVFFVGCADLACSQGQIAVKQLDQLPAVDIALPSDFRGELYGGHIQPVSAVAIAPDGRVASVDGTAHLTWWRAMALDPASQYFDGDKPQSVVIIFGTGRRSGQVNTTTFSDPAMSPDGELVAATENVYLGYGQHLDLWTRNGKAVGQLSPERPVFSPDGKVIAGVSREGGSNGGQVSLFDVATRAPAATLDWPDYGVSQTLNSSVWTWTWALAFSPDGKKLASGAATRVDDSATGKSQVQASLTTWDTSSDKVLRRSTFRWSLESNQSITLSLSPDLAMVATSVDSKLTLLDATSGNTLTPDVNVQLGIIRQVAFSPGGSMLAAIDESGTTVVWDMKSRQVVDRVDTASQTVTASAGSDPYVSDAAPADATVAFSPDGKDLLMSWGGAAQVWDLQQHQTFVDLPHMGTYILQAAFSPDGKAIVWAAHEPVGIFTRTLVPSSWLAEACALAGRNLTATEWQEFIGSQPQSNQKVCPKLP